MAIEMSLKGSLHFAAPRKADVMARDPVRVSKYTSDIHIARDLMQEIRYIPGLLGHLSQSRMHGCLDGLSHTAEIWSKGPLVQ